MPDVHKKQLSVGLGLYLFAQIRKAARIAECSVIDTIRHTLAQGMHDVILDDADKAWMKAELEKNIRARRMRHGSKHKDKTGA